MTGWLVWNATPVHYQGGYYYSENTDVNNSVSYSGQSQEIVQSVAKVDMESADWMSLGVFALSKDSVTAETPTIYVQLAISKEGAIAGTYYDSASNVTQPIQGIVDESTQRASWRVTDRTDTPIMETGLYNLTESQTPVRALFPDGTTQEWLMVRLEE